MGPRGPPAVMTEYVAVLTGVPLQLDNARVDWLFERVPASNNNQIALSSPRRPLHNILMK